MGVALAIVVGFVFGAADQYLGSLVWLGPWTASVSGLSAPWLVLPFAFGCARRGLAAGALIGFTATMAALLGYFAMTLSPIEGVSLSHVSLLAFTRSQLHVILPGLITGPVFGALGYRWRETRSWLSAALVAGAVCLEPLARMAVGRLDGPPVVWSAEAGLGISLAVCFVLAGAGYRRRA